MDDIKASVMSLKLGRTSPSIRKATSSQSLHSELGGRERGEGEERGGRGGGRWKEGKGGGRFVQLGRKKVINFCLPFSLPPFLPLSLQL